MNDSRMIQLPNKDLWRGYKDGPAPSTGVTDITRMEETPLSPLDKAMGEVVASAKGAKQLSCLWCGLQGGYTWMIGHLTTNHKSIVDPPNPAAVAVAAIPQPAAKVEPESIEE